MNAGLQWIDWNGRDWDGDPDQLVHVRFHDGVDDTHMAPTPARNLGLKDEPSNWRWSRPTDVRVVAYAIPSPAPFIHTASGETT